MSMFSGNSFIKAQNSNQGGVSFGNANNQNTAATKSLSLTQGPGYATPSAAYPPAKDAKGLALTGQMFASIITIKTQEAAKATVGVTAKTTFAPR